MIHRFNLIVLFCTIAWNSNSQATIEAAWLSQYDNSNPSILSYQLMDMVVDSEGNPILAFNVSQEVDLGGGYIYDKHYFTIVKIDSLNNIVWEKEMMSDQLQVHQAEAEFSGMDIDQDDNLYINGTFNVYIAPGMFFDTIFVQGQGEILGKLNSDGDALWATVHNSGYGRNLCYEDGFIYGIGEHEVNTDVGPNTAEYGAQGGNIESYIYKIDTDGNYYWLAEIDSFATVGQIDVYGDQIYLTGQHNNNTIFPGGTVSSMSNYGKYILNLDTAASFQWVKEYHFSALTQSILRIDSLIYIGGNCAFGFSFGPFTAGNTDNQNFILALDTLSNEQWLHSFSMAGQIDLANYSDKLMVMSRTNGISTISTPTTDNTAFIAIVEADGNVSNYVQKSDFVTGPIYVGSTGAHFSGGNPGELWLGGHYLQGKGYVCGRLEDAASLNLPQQSADFLIYPNPATNALYISSSRSEITLLQLINMQGEKVEVGISQSNDKTCLDLNYLPDGTYLLRFQQAGKWHSRKFLKQ
jgi:hypothetical protein